MGVLSWIVVIRCWWMLVCQPKCCGVSSLMHMSQIHHYYFGCWENWHQNDPLSIFLPLLLLWSIHILKKWLVGHLYTLVSKTHGSTLKILNYIFSIWTGFFSQYCGKSNPCNCVIKIWIHCIINYSNTVCVNFMLSFFPFVFFFFLL